MHSSILRFEPGVLLVLRVSNETGRNEKMRSKIKRKTYKDIIIYRKSIDVVQPGFQQLVFYILNKITSRTVNKKTSSLLFLLFSKLDIFSMLAIGHCYKKCFRIKFSQKKTFFSSETIFQDVIFPSWLHFSSQSRVSTGTSVKGLARTCQIPGKTYGKEAIYNFLSVLLDIYFLVLCGPHPRPPPTSPPTTSFVWKYANYVSGTTNECFRFWQPDSPAFMWIAILLNWISCLKM